ncbi:resolvase family protein [Firmicutes bacterium CAG:95]|nr:resolvase family protein [Firmicutes bacterium CAG:95]
MEKYGYIRVSTKDQNPERQSAAFEKYGIRSENVYLDKASGKNFERPAYQNGKKRRCYYYKKHRPAWKKLWRNTGSVAVYYKRPVCGNRST